MKLAVSNIAWEAEQDERVYYLMGRYGYTGLEIAPTRIFPGSPYDRLREAREWAKGLKVRYGLTVPSMQSVWYGRQEKLFGSGEDREALLKYTKKAIDFAAAVGCRNLVFGCPKNRAVPYGMSMEEAERIAAAFFRAIGRYADSNGTAVGLEANPKIYGTNYINTTREALELVHKVDSPGFRLNLDAGTMIQNGESVRELAGSVGLISHVHISEPGLKPITARNLHRKLRELLEKEEYKGYISIEMGRQEDIPKIENVMKYVEEVFGD